MTNEKGCNNKMTNYSFLENLNDYWQKAFDEPYDPYDYERPVTTKSISDGIKTAFNNGEYEIGLVKESMNVATVSHDQQRNIFQVARELTKHLGTVEADAVRITAPDLYRVMFQEIPVGQRPEDNNLFNY